jgi:hypothetical protein
VAYLLTIKIDTQDLGGGCGRCGDTSDVRYWVQSRHDSESERCPFVTPSRHKAGGHGPRCLCTELAGKNRKLRPAALKSVSKCFVWPSQPPRRPPRELFRILALIA